MKAWELHGFGRENLALTDKPIPKPSQTEVLVRVGAVSLNYRDKLLVEGFYNPGMRFPMTQVADAVGQVVEIGRDVTRFRVGHRVIVQYCTRWVDGPPHDNEGLHSLGNTIQGALAEYDAKLERVKALGAGEGINHARTSEWEKEVLKLTAHAGVDHILEVAGGKSLAQSIAAIKPGGQIAVIGILENFSSDFPIFSLLLKQVILRGISVGPRRALEDMTRKFEQLQLHPVIDTVYPFADALAAYDHLYRGAFGKIVIRVTE